MSIYIQMLFVKVSDEFEALKTELSVYCIYGGTPYAPQGTVWYNNYNSCKLV